MNSLKLYQFKDATFTQLQSFPLFLKLISIVIAQIRCVRATSWRMYQLLVLYGSNWIKILLLSRIILSMTLRKNLRNVYKSDDHIVFFSF